MGTRFIRQPNGLLARFSTITDTFTHTNLTEQEVRELVVADATSRAQTEAQEMIERADIRSEETLRECLASMRANHREIDEPTFWEVIREPVDGRLEQRVREQDDDDDEDDDEPEACQHPTAFQLDYWMSLAKKHKREFHLIEQTGQWCWSDQDASDDYAAWSRPSDTFGECLFSAVRQYLPPEEEGPGPLRVEEEDESLYDHTEYERSEMSGETGRVE